MLVVGCWLVVVVIFISFIKPFPYLTATLHSHSGVTPHYESRS